MINSKSENYKIAYFAWIATTVLYFYQYILRILPNVMINEIRYDFSMDAHQFGFFGSLALYTYAIMQIPIGIITDKFGIKKTVTSSIALCIISNLILSVSNSIYIAYLSRILVGLGSACAFLCAIKIIADFLPKGQKGLLTGLTLTAGSLGAVLSAKPVVSIMDNYGWKDTLFIIALIGILVFLLNVIFIKSHLHTKHNIRLFRNFSSFLIYLKNILIDHNIIFYSVVAVGLYTPLSVLADLWSTDFLIKKYSLTRYTASYISTMLYFGLGIGSIIFSWLSEKFNLVDEILLLCTTCLLGLIVFLIYGPVIDKSSLTILLTIIGVFCGAEMVCFIGALHFSSKQNSGTVVGIVNTFNMLLGGIAQHFIGIILDINWYGNYDSNGIRYYTAEEYKYALSCLVLILIICFFTTFVRFKSKKKFDFR